MVVDGCTESKTECVGPLHIAVRQQGVLLCRMAFQEMKWVSIGRRDTENFDLENMAHVQNEIGTPIFDTYQVAPIWSDEAKN